MRKLIAALALAWLAGLAGAQAQTFPSRQITLVVPFPPGGSTDVAARIMAEKMRPILGQAVIIENDGGAGGSIAVGRVARAAPDGYTIDIGQWDTHVGSIIYNLNYDLQKDFEPIGLISVNPQLLVAKKNLPANKLSELVAWMKANPGDAKFVNQNAAAPCPGLLLQQLTDTKVTFIPYRGAGPAMTDLVSGQVDLLVVQGAVTLPQIRGGTIKAIANLSPQRSASMPDIPTSDETGVPGLYMSGWFGFWAPKGTPKDVIAKLNGAMMQVLADPTTKAKFAELGLDVASKEQQTPEGARRVPEGRDREVVADHQGGQHQGRVTIMKKLLTAIAAAAACLARRSAPGADLSDAADHASWCRSRPAGRPTPSRASSPSGCGRRSARPSWSRTPPAPPAPSASAGSCAPRPTATRSASATGARTSSTARSIR